MYVDWEKEGVCIRVCMCVWFMIWDMFFVVRSNDSFNFPLGLIKYIVIIVINYLFFFFFPLHRVIYGDNGDTVNQMNKVDTVEQDNWRKWKKTKRKNKETTTTKQQQKSMFFKEKWCLWLFPCMQGLPLPTRGCGVGVGGGREGRV